MKKFYKLLLLCILILSGGNALRAHVHESANASSSKLYGEFDSCLEIDQTEMIIAVGHSATLNASVGSYPPTHEPGNITFYSSNSSIATVDNNGNINAIAAGEVTITVKLALKYIYIDGAGSDYDYAEQKCYVTVCGHEHSYHDSATDNGDGTHSFICTECNAEVSEAHTGDATCTTEAACTLCGAYYTNPNNHEYESNNGFCCGTIQAAERNADGFYEIYNAGNLFWFAEHVNTTDRTASAKLMNDIDLENRAWTPIGSTGEGNNNFRGHFDGNGKTITGLYVNALRAGLGFFGEVRGGTVEDFTIYGEVELNGKYDYVGGVIGSAPGFNSNQPDHNGATIRNITSFVNVTLGEGSHGSNRVAGFIGYANHETLIENCTWYGTLDLGPYRAQDGVGGLVGKTNDNSAVTIRNCAAYGTIKTSYKSGSYNNHNTIYIGGIVSNSVSSAQTTLENCVWAGSLVNNTDLGSNAHISAIGTLNGSKSVTNCYALDNMPYVTTHNAHNTGITTVTAEQLASGEIAYKLQGTQTTQIWGQNIDNGETADACPILGGAKVYEYNFDSEKKYSNTNITAGGQCGDNLYWKVIDNSLTIFGTGAMYDYNNTDNKAPWRNLNPAPISLVLEEGITHIGNWAFENCKGLNGSLTIPNSVMSIGDYAFYECSGFTGSLTIPNSVTSIGDWAFADCRGFTGSLTIPNSVTTIGNYAFYKCSGFNGSLTIPNSVTSIGDNAFYECLGFTGSLTIPNSVTSIGNSAFYYCEGFNGSLTIPNSVTSIGSYAFYNCKGFNGSLTIPNSVTAIGNYAFYNCKRFKGSLTIPNSVTNIGDYAFQNCSGFNGSLTIGNIVTSIGREAFYGCSGFTEVYSLAETAPTLGTNAFKYINGNATLYYLTSSEQSYNDKGWFNYFPQHIGLFDGKCGDNLYWVVNDNVLTISGTGAMYDYDNIDNKAPWRSLNPAPTSLVLEEGITSIGNYAFHLCSGFTGSLTIPNSVTTIGDRAFDGCSGFKGSLTIGDSVTTIGDYAFYECIGFTGSLTIPNSVTTIGDRAFNGCSGFTGSLTIGNSVTTIGNRAFFNCSGFNGSLTIPNSVTSIGNSAFYECSGFTGSLTIPNSVTSIGDWAVADCRGFTGSLTIPNSVTTIGNSAFRNCSGFNGSLTIPNSVTSIGNYAFRNCSGFTGSLTIPNSVTTIGYAAFHLCYGFTGSLTIPNSVTTIGEYAFHLCYGFTGSLTIPNSVTTIGNNAFEYCDGFTDIFFYRDTNPTIGSNVFNGISSTAKIYAPVIWSSYSNIPEDKLVKMATYVGQQSTDNGQQSSSTAWVGLAEGQTEPGENDHVAINAPLVLGSQQDNKTTRQQGSTANSLSVKSFGYCGNGTTVNGSITIEDGGQLYCEVARGEVTVKKDIIGYAETTRLQDNETTSETVWYTIASPLKDTMAIIPNSSFLIPNSDLYRYDEPTYTWQNAKNSDENGFNTIDPGRGYLYANAEDTTLEFTGMINTDEVTYNLTTDGDVLTGFHLVGNPFTHNITFAHLNATEGAELVNGYYVLNGEGAWGATLGSNEDDVIKVGQGVLVKATNAGT